MFMCRFFFFLLIVMLSLIGCRIKNDNQTIVEKKTIINEKAAPDAFYFVGKALYTPGIYKYSFYSKKRKIIWSSKNQRVIVLSYSDNLKNAFFITAKSYGKLGVFPFVEKIRLYTLETQTGKINFVKVIGSGMEVYTQWETDDTFSIILNSLDENIATYVNQQKQIFNVFGKLLRDETKTYDLTADGYPSLTKKEREGLSPNAKYFFTVKTDSINVYTISSGKENKEIISTSQVLRKFEWEERNKLIFTTADLTPANKTLYSKNPETSKIIIYSPETDEILKFWEGGGVKNFLIMNNKLIFDTGFENESKINLIDLETFKQFDVIKIQGGCGIKYIPEIPDYGN